MAFANASLTTSDSTAYNLSNTSFWDKLTAAHIHWEAYFEGVTLANFFTNTDGYTFKHNPVGFCHPYNGSLDTSSPYTGGTPTAFYSNADGSKVANAGSVGTAWSTSGSVNNFGSSSTFTNMLASMKSSTPASFYWAGPALVNQAHGGTWASPWNGSASPYTADADAFAAYMITQIMTTAWYKNHGNIILWWDEGAHPPTVSQTNLVIINEGKAKAKGGIGSSTATLDHFGLVYDLLVNTYKVPAIGSATSQAGSLSGILDIATTTLVPTSLSFSTPPSAVVSGSAFSPAIAVQTLDQNGNAISTSDQITLAVASGTGSLSGVTQPVTAVNGVATFTGLILTGTAGTFTLTATTTSTGIASVTSSGFQLSATSTAATQLGMVTQPASPQAPGVAFTVSVQLEDSTGAPKATSGTTVTVALGLNPTTDTLGGTTSVTTDSNGLATFSTLFLNNASTSPYTLVFASSGLTSVTSAQFLETIPAVTQSGTAKGIVGLLNRQGFPPFSATDPYMNALSGYVVKGSVTTDGVAWSELQPTSFGAIVRNNPIDTAISAVRAQMAVAGQTRQWMLKLRIFTGELAPTWAKQRGGGPITGSQSGATVTMGAWWTLEWQAAWKDLMTKLAAIYDSVPEIGEVVCAHAGTQGMETLLKNDYDSGSSPGNANALTKGIYTQDWSWAVDKAAHQTAAAFMATVWATTPSSVAFNPAIVINSTTADETFTETLMDYVVANVPTPLGVLENNSLRANGTSGSSGLYETIDSNGNVTDGHGTNYSSMYTHMMALGPKAVKNTSYGAKAVLGFVPGNGPSNAVVNTVITPPVLVAVEDASNNVVLSDQTDTITLAIATGAGTLTGTLTQTVINGVATFSDLQINTAGTFTLVASSATTPGLTHATSASFSITTAVSTASLLAMGTQPSATPPATDIFPSITVKITDSAGVVVTGSSASVTVALGLNTTSGTLSATSGTLVVAAVSGVATFDTLQIDNLGTYTLVFTSPGLTSITSAQFTIQSTSTRSVLKQPFASTSIWNYPIGSNAVYVSSGTGWPLLTPTIQSLHADNTIVLMDPTQPLTNILQNGGFQSNRCTGTTTLATVPMAASFVVPSATHNYSTGACLTDGRGLVDGDCFGRCTAGSFATLAHLAPSNSDLFGDGLAGGKGGSRLSSLGGCLRMGEMLPGAPPIPHVLAADLDSFDNCVTAFRWPATKSDSYSYNGTNTQAVPGALFALRPSFNVAALQTVPGRQLATCLQNYGAYNTNDTKSSRFSLCTELGPAGDFLTEFQKAWGYAFEVAATDTTPWAKDVKAIYAGLAVINNNTANNIGGGGTPRVPMAPAAGP